MQGFDEMQLKEYQKFQGMEENRCAFFAHVMYGDRLYYVDNQYNRLFCMNPESGESEFIMYIKERKCESDIYAYMVSYKDELWLIPWMKREITIVDLKANTITELKIPSAIQEIRGENNAINPLFSCIYNQGDSTVWLLPYGSNGMLKVDMECHEMSQINMDIPDIEWKDGHINFYGGVLAGESIWFCSCKYPRGLIYDTVEKTFTTYEWNYDRKNYSHIYQYKDWICFFPEDMCADVIMINQKTKEIKKISTKNKTEGKRYFMTAINGEYAITTPFIGKNYYCLNLETAEMKISKKPQITLEKNGISTGRYQTCFSIGSKVFFVSDFESIPMLVYDIKRNEAKFLDVYYEQEQYERKLREQLEKDASRVLNCVNLKKGPITERIFPLNLAVPLLTLN